MMEVFAGFLEHTDHHYGRLFEFPEGLGGTGQHADHVHLRQRRQRRGRTARVGEREQVLQQCSGVAGREPQAIDELGGPKYFNHYSWGWTFAGNTPFRRWKRETYRGGISDPFMVHWPKGIKAKGEIRTQFAHAIDMVPTVLECLGIDAAGSDQRSHTVAHRRRQLRTYIRRCQGGIEASSRNTSRCSDTGPSITMAGARCVLSLGRPSRKRPWNSARRSPKTS